MCGITGWVDWERDLTDCVAVVRAMTDTMVCRGPDAEGYRITRHAALGHRRLSIIDLEGGAQPMGDEQRGVLLSYSGEVYNFRELRTELEGLGHTFRTRSDTEVVLRAYLEWGTDSVARLNGMFGFAIWDAEREELLLVRDRLGVKPLYYAQTPSGLLFGSEPKAVLANPLFQPELDDEGISELLLTPPLKTPGHGVFRGLREVRPGHLVRVSRSGVREQRYWQLVSDTHQDDLPTTIATVRSILTDTVSRQLVSDVPLCSLLSGGLDSSAITALAAAELTGQGAGKLSTFSMEFRGSEEHFKPDALRPSLDTPFAHAVAGHLGTRHTHIVLDPQDLLADQLDTLRARDLPGMGDMDVSLLLLFKEVRKHSTVALSGESADEVFGGYPWFHDPEALKNPGFPWAHGRTGRYEVLDPGLLQRLQLREYVKDRYVEAIGEVPYLDGEEGIDRRLREVFHLNLTRFLPALLDRKDRMSMAAGLEVRVPFCDHRLIEYLWNIPWWMKNVGSIEKGLLRKAVGDLLPEEVANRPKSAFPVAQDPAYDAAVRDRLRDILADSNSPLLNLVDKARLTATLAAPTGEWNGPQSTAWLGYLLEVDTWLRTYRVRIR
ncbi:asparagine synthase (glutamine-hydrolyzing) [Kitasatospora sp. MAP12-15]|uniref:asparagine synthase (glutamine-hydrolyzing) n=1 Tax=unclassified Kitasatospora TaxID=2633591 RepID=UPI0024760FFE|nr:asparagine synthase (glutamine-hydrolyzing) [Kitasatospora sp. MAP12-44]MDH6111069.1 asparagine synthase (glutamine-hydrolyzing) [Kitasatospora sp. MAP12-44]